MTRAGVAHGARAVGAAPRIAFGPAHRPAGFPAGRRTTGRRGGVCRAPALIRISATRPTSPTAPGRYAIGDVPLNMIRLLG